MALGLSNMAKTAKRKTFNFDAAFDYTTQHNHEAAVRRKKHAAVVARGRDERAMHPSVFRAPVVGDPKPKSERKIYFEQVTVPSMTKTARNEEVRAMRATGESIRSVARKFGISPTRVVEICKPPSYSTAG
jgi:hypothetical protein